MSKHLMAKQLAANTENWTLGALITYAQDNLNKGPAPIGNVYSWRMQDLLEFCFSVYYDELQSLSEAVLADMINLSTEESSD